MSKQIQVFLNKKEDKKAEVLIYDTIGSGWLGGISAQDFARDLRELGELDEINVRINSDGGNVFDGVTIHNTLVSNRARVTVDVDGLAASIASIIAMAGDTVRMAHNAMFMIHDPWIVAAGSATELREQADLLDKVKGVLIDTYDARSSVDKVTIEKLMAEETWMTADEALDYGFIDEVTEELKIAAHVNVERFKHVPDTLVAQVKEEQAKNEFKPVASEKLKLMRAKLKARNL